MQRAGDVLLTNPPDEQLPLTYIILFWIFHFAGRVNRFISYIQKYHPNHLYNIRLAEEVHKENRNLHPKNQASNNSTSEEGESDSGIEQEREQQEKQQRCSICGKWGEEELVEWTPKYNMYLSNRYFRPNWTIKCCRKCLMELTFLCAQLRCSTFIRLGREPESPRDQEAAIGTFTRDLQYLNNLPAHQVTEKFREVIAITTNEEEETEEVVEDKGEKRKRIEIEISDDERDDDDDERDDDDDERNNEGEEINKSGIEQDGAYEYEEYDEEEMNTVELGAIEEDTGANPHLHVDVLLV
jgi:hypothetical protein